MHFPIVAALLAASVAQDDPFCADISRLSAAAGEEKPFESLYQAKFVPRLLNSCQRGVGYFCHRSLLPPEITYETMATRIAACLPGAVKAMPAQQWPGIRRVTVTGGGLFFDIEETGSDRAHVGRILHIEIRSEKQPRPEHWYQ
ncbi:hypothetical protein P6144_01135 [Sphingomonas sp. HITSZ_GF]|uniref:hypothetical protein n=1 Tax=Sphingomonas sp. HITSZ_GF TaxID=3037247 RepID=UPI00240D4960|nr:hypothetical protein [Sphingomonas sp. HITSZ_GF]MDG2532238.1 hypothetical protein [Sphingomonas sp. HITSZ_GF]